MLNLAENARSDIERFDDGKKTRGGLPATLGYP
jgi:hypothetical protein